MTMDNIESFYPLSPMQQGMLFHAVLALQPGAYFQQLSYTLKGNPDLEAFSRAWDRVSERHAVLRTAFMWEGLKEPVQVVHKHVRVTPEPYDWRGFSPAQQQEQLEAFLKADRDRGFDLSIPPLMRAVLIRISGEAHKFILSYHHLLLDGWSTPLLFKEVQDYYEAFCRGEDLTLESPRPYRDYIVWLRKQDLSKAEAYWRHALDGFTTPTTLKVNRVRDPEPGDVAPEAGVRQTALSAEISSALRATARQQRVTLNTIVQGAWALLLSRYSGEEDVVFGATVSGRPVELSGVEAMVGLFMNTLPVRVLAPPDEPLGRWLQKLQARQAELRQYEHSPLVEVQKWSQNPGGVPLFDTLLVFENVPAGNPTGEEFVSLEVQDIRVIEKNNYPLTLVVIPGSEISITALYDAQRFEAETMDQILDHFGRMLCRIAARPEVRLRDVEMLCEDEAWLLERPTEIEELNANFLL